MEELRAAAAEAATTKREFADAIQAEVNRTQQALEATDKAAAVLAAKEHELDRAERGVKRTAAESRSVSARLKDAEAQVRKLRASSAELAQQNIALASERDELRVACAEAGVEVRPSSTPSVSTEAAVATV